MRQYIRRSGETLKALFMGKAGEIGNGVASDTFAGGVLAGQEVVAAFDPEGSVLSVWVGLPGQAMQKDLGAHRGIGAAVRGDLGAAVRPELGFEDDLETFGMFRIEADPEIVGRRRRWRHRQRRWRRNEDGSQVREREQ